MYTIFTRYSRSMDFVFYFINFEINIYKNTIKHKETRITGFIIFKIYTTIN